MKMTKEVRFDINKIYAKARTKLMTESPPCEDSVALALKFKSAVSPFYHNHHIDTILDNPDEQNQQRKQK
jgi:hypothetical protein